MIGYDTDLDWVDGSSGADIDGDPGPYLHWHTKGTDNRVIAPNSFSLRGPDGMAPITLTHGVVLDWPTLKLGWCQSTGQPGSRPIYVWSESRAKPLPKPPGANQRRAISVVLAFDHDQRALWEQAGFNCYACAQDVFAVLKQAGAKAKLPLLPLFLPNGFRALQVGQGTTVPVLVLKDFVPRPACLGAAPSLVKPRPAPPAPTASPTNLDDEIPF
jgi:hypothetical protein